MSRDPSITALLLPQLAQRLQDQAAQLEAATGALRAVEGLARSVHAAAGGLDVTAQHLDVIDLAHLAATMAAAVQRPLTEIDIVASELERCQRG
jgi:hypothetical protein